MADRRNNIVFWLLFTVWRLINVCQNQELYREIDTCKGLLKGCYCTEYIIDCLGADFTDIEDIYAYITENTTQISITGGSLKVIPDDLFLEPLSREIYDYENPDGARSNKLDKLHHLNLTGNQIEELGRNAFRHMKNLQSLDLSDNDIVLYWCDPRSKNPLMDFKKLEMLLLRNAFGTNSMSFSCDLGNVLVDVGVTNLNTLDISSNDFRTAGKQFESIMCSTDSLTSLNFSNNNFNRLPVPTCMVNLVHLDVSNNKLEYLTADEMDEIEGLLNLEELRLGGNPFDCQCLGSVLDTITWLNTTNQPLDFEEMTCQICNGNQNCVGMPLLKANIIECEPNIAICYGPIDIKVAKSTLYVIVSASVLALVSIICAIILIRRRRARRQHHGVNTEEVEDDIKSPGYTRMV